MSSMFSADLEETEDRLLRDLAEERDISVAQLMREAIRVFLQLQMRESR